MMKQKLLVSIKSAEEKKEEQMVLMKDKRCSDDNQN